jgi:septal ring factor EnvC (AmiA/AmiB activator)
MLRRVAPLALPILLVAAPAAAPPAAAQEPGAPGSGAPGSGGPGSGGPEARSGEADPRARLEELQRRIEAGEADESAAQARFRALQTEVSRLRQESIAAAGRIQGLERALSMAEIALAFRKTSELRQRRRLAERNAQLGVTLGALQRIALQPPEALLAAPGGTLETARSATLLSTTVPELERRAEAVRVEVRRLAALTAATEAERDALAGTRDALAAERGRLEDLARQKISLQQQALADSAEAAARVQALADEAEDLQALLRKLSEEARARRQREAEAALAALQAAERARRAGAAELEELRAEPADDVARAREQTVGTAQAPGGSENRTAGQVAGQGQGAGQGATGTRAGAQVAAQVAALPATPLAKPGSVRPFPRSPGTLRLPVAGSLAVSFGERQVDGIDARARGIYMESRPGAQVVAPFDGQVAFAGRFRRYGLLLIIEHDGRYHSLLSGLERIDAVVGQWVLAGEPVGVMGRRAGGAGSPRLYYELRRDSRPIDPLPWLAMDEEKARG